MIFFLCQFLGTPISKNIYYLVVASENIVNNILIIKKTKKMFSFSQKHISRNSKKSIYIFFNYFFIFYFQPKNFFWLKKSKPHLRNSPPLRFMPPNFLKSLTPTFKIFKIFYYNLIIIEKGSKKNK